MRGVLHCYTGSHALAEAALAVGWYVSFSGIVTFRKWTDDALLRLVPRDRLLVESDAPYLAPVPHRGKRNEPAWVSRTAARVAETRGTDPSEFAAQAPPTPSGCSRSRWPAERQVRIGRILPK